MADAASIPHLDRANAAEVEIARLQEKMSSDQAQAFEAWQTVERQEERIEELSSLLLDVEGSLLAYWTDIPQSEIQRLLPLIREALAGDTE